VGQGQGVFLSKHSRAISKQENVVKKISEKLNLYQIVTDRIVDNLEKVSSRGRSLGSPRSSPAASFRVTFRLANRTAA
jgi:hypothetical protein